MEELIINGAVYNGEVENGKANGKGKIVFQSGDVVEGIFKDNEPISGICFYSNGNKYEGEIYDLLPDGKGKFTYVNGDFYEGYFKEGLYEGKGTLHQGDIIINGIFQNGKLETEVEELYDFNDENKVTVTKIKENFIDAIVPNITDKEIEDLIHDWAYCNEKSKYKYSLKKIFVPIWQFSVKYKIIIQYSTLESKAGLAAPIIDSGEIVPYVSTTHNKNKKIANENIDDYVLKRVDGEDYYLNKLLNFAFKENIERIDAKKYDYDLINYNVNKNEIDKRLKNRLIDDVLIDLKEECSKVNTFICSSSIYSCDIIRGKEKELYYPVIVVDLESNASSFMRNEYIPYRAYIDPISKNIYGESPVSDNEDRSSNVVKTFFWIGLFTFIAILILIIVWSVTSI